MKSVPLLIALSFLALTLPVHAMSDESAHFQGTDEKAQYADPDEKTEFGSGNATTNSQGPSGREQFLLGQQSNSQPTYGFGGHDGSLSYGFSQGSGFSPYQSWH